MFSSSPMNNTRILIPVLMAVSMALLIILQVLWLRNSLDDAKESFQKETSALFRATVVALQDSLIVRSIRPMDGDSTTGHPIKKRLRVMRSIEGKASAQSDTLLDYYNLEKGEARVEMLVTTESRDSLPRMLRPLVRRLHDAAGPQSFIVRLDQDSLKPDTIRKYFAASLRQAHIDADFEVHYFGPEKIIRRMDATMTEPVRLTPLRAYTASFAGADSLILRRIAPQFFFSLFITVFTAAAFLVMYRNIRAQQRLMELKNDFISNVTHELKTPVATVSVALEALSDFHAMSDPKKTSEYLGIARSELNRLNLMTDKILKTAIFDAGTLDIRKEPFDLDKLSRDVLTSMKMLMDQKNLSVTYRTRGEDFHVNGSATHFSNVVYNLIDNAVKYSRQGGILDVTLDSDQESIRLIVRDNGIGIPEEFRDKIFEKFFRVPSGDVHNTKGHGLGLSYVQGVVRSHDGNISVESVPGKGSAFIINLPRS